jgi:tetratricopeptide (TPR) repeat protein
VIIFSFIYVSTDQALAVHDGLIIETPSRVATLDATPETKLNTGPCVGRILNVHYFPGLIDYSKGNYRYAIRQLDYVLARPEYTSMNPRQGGILSHGHYVRGMIMLYHASGSGKLVRAKADFEQAIQWNANNHLPYFELARLLSMAGLKEQATQVIHQLLGKQPSEEIAQKAREEFMFLQSGVPK